MNLSKCRRVVAIAVLYALIGMGLTGCAGLGDISQEPSITVDSVRPVQLSQDRCLVSVRLIMINNSPLTLAYNRAVIRLESLASSRPCLQELRPDLLVPGYMSRSADLQLRVATAELRRLFGSGKDRASLRISGRLFAGKKYVTFFTESEMALPRMPEVRLILPDPGQPSARITIENPNHEALTLTKIEGRVIRSGQVWDFQPLPATESVKASATAVVTVPCMLKADGSEGEGNAIFGQLEYQTPSGLTMVQVLSPRMVAPNP